MRAGEPVSAKTGPNKGKGQQKAEIRTVQTTPASPAPSLPLDLSKTNELMIQLIEVLSKGQNSYQRNGYYRKYPQNQKRRYYQQDQEDRYRDRYRDRYSDEYQRDGAGPSKPRESRPTEERTCYICKSPKHWSAECPQKGKGPQNYKKQKGNEQGAGSQVQAQPRK